MNPFANWKQADVDAYNRRGIPQPEAPSRGKSVTRESDLHNEIMAACRLRGWQYLHGSMAGETHRTLGEPDFLIMATKGRLFFIECKRKGGKLSPAQLAFKCQAEHNGHVIHIVYSMADFYRVIGENL